jgi:hypothetical protein
MVGYAKEPGPDVCLAPEGEMTTKCDDEHVMHQIFDIRVGPCQPTCPAFDLMSVRLVQIVEAIRSRLGGLPFWRRTNQVQSHGF